MKKIVKIFVAALCLVIVSIIGLTIYHQVALRIEKDKIQPNGQMIDVDDYKIHVYSEGENDNEPTLIFLSGSGTVAPVYDFKSLYSLLSDEYKIAVVEKAGYGYSDHAKVRRDVKSMVEEVKTALTGANLPAPYVLLPHSMSGLEAIYWQQTYPDEIQAIIGLDMAVPHSYDDFNNMKVQQTFWIGNITTKLGIIRIPGMYPLQTQSLTKTERQQQKYLMYKNAVNSIYAEELKEVVNNAKIVLNGPVVSSPIVLFVSNGKEIGDYWIKAQEEFAVETNAEIIKYDCGHYLHYYKSEEMATKIKFFIHNLKY